MQAVQMESGVANEAFGELLRRYRAGVGLSQVALSARSGLSVDAISMLERGIRRIPRTSTVVRLAEALRLRPPDREALIATALEVPGSKSRHQPPMTVIPRELPRAPADFIGRVEELVVLGDLLVRRGNRVGIAAIDGMGGVGKSALAIQLAHQLTEAGVFPDGQLYVNLHGASPALPALEPHEALSRMLRSLGVGPSVIPTEVEEAAAQLRSLVANRRLLMLLDNARDLRQVRPLMPGSPTCSVLVTSRRVLSSLDGIHALHLSVLPEEQALELFGCIVGQERVARELQAAADVVRMCGQLALAIRIAGARLVARPHWPIRELAQNLADPAHRLEQLCADHLALGASFNVSLEALRRSPNLTDQAAADAFGPLSLTDGPDFGAKTAARVLDDPEPVIQPWLERLVDAQLLESPRAGIYRFHDLMRLFAREHATGWHPQPAAPAAVCNLQTRPAS